MGSINEEIALLKSRVKGHYRRTKGGKKTHVRPHERKTKKRADKERAKRPTKYPYGLKEGDTVSAISKPTKDNHYRIKGVVEKNYWNGRLYVQPTNIEIIKGEKRYGQSVFNAYIMKQKYPLSSLKWKKE